MAKSLTKTKLETKKVSPIRKTKIKVIGIGGGGGNIVSELAQRVKKVTFLAANTDLQALQLVSRKVERFSFGQSFTQGLGTGMNLEIAEMAGRNEKERIKKILQDQDLIIFIACLGGGTGSGATPIFAKISQSLGNLSYGIFTLPFKFEGEKKMEIAKRALEILRPKLNAITILPNEKIFEIIDRTTPLKEAFSAINKSLAQSLEGLIETIYQPGLINIDFADLKTILSGSPGRLAYLNTLSLIKKEGAAKELVEKVLTSPLYPYGIKGVKAILFNIMAEKGLSLKEISQISKTISEKTHPEAKIIFGISPTGKFQNFIKTTIFATGCSTTAYQNFGWTTIKVQKKPRGKKIKQSIKRPVEKKANVKTGFLEKKTQKVKKVKFKKQEKELPVQSEENQQIKQINKIGSVENKISNENSKIGQADYESEKSSLNQSEKEKTTTLETKIAIKVRKNGLQLKKELEEEEKEILKKEKFWEIPAFLRKKTN